MAPLFERIERSIPKDHIDTAERIIEKMRAGLNCCCDLYVYRRKRDNKSDRTAEQTIKKMYISTDPTIYNPSILGYHTCS